MSKHTEGPWEADGLEIDSQHFNIAKCFLSSKDMDGNEMPREIKEANARLIAAAPELLAALQWYMAEWNSDTHDDIIILAEQMADKARAAIAKATEEK